MFRHALLLVHLVSSAYSTPTYYDSAYHHPAVFYFQPPSPYFRSPFHPYVPTPSYYAPQSYPAYHQTVTPGSDVVAKPTLRSNYLRNEVSDDATVVEAAPAPPSGSINPKYVLDASQIAPGLIYRTSPDVVSHGVHLGNVYPPQEGYSQDGFANDAPPSTFTQGPHPGSYTSVSSDEESEGTLFQSQDGNGNILFGYSSPQQARLEARSLDGSVRGSYSYIDPEGKTVKVRYSAGRDGFQVFDEDEAFSVIPKQVKDTPEVEAAKSLHARLYQQAKWLAEQPESYEDPLQVVHPVPLPVQPVQPAQPEKQDEAQEQYNDPDDKIHPPDSIYTVSEGVKGVEEDLEYYGAAKGTVPMTYASRFNTYGTPLSEQQHLRRAAGAPAPLLSAYSAPSLRELQHLHRAGKSLKSEERNPVPLGAFPSSYGGQTVPVFVGVAPQSDEIASTRSALVPLPVHAEPPNNKEQQAIPPASISQKANFFGAVPVAAVHDTQVSPQQRVSDHQTKPVYVEAN
ncbi:uncharacterized protein LOC132194312 [Neocloeon triangulifer]|uniref:uncharacterized protein LOC132194312 n=1 Tax=Neocloeon triangulifer TaxID=2078957 RepID=UPI00286F4C2F|nr:uncharacterized protein LOC132194312 [Neocloeon triangulifer]